MEKKMRAVRIIIALIVIITAILVIGGLAGQGDMTARTCKKTGDSSFARDAGVLLETADRNSVIPQSVFL